MKFAKCNSHRTRRNLLNALNRKPQSYWSLNRKCFHGIYEITDQELTLAKAIKGITIIRGDTSDLMRTW